MNILIVDDDFTILKNTKKYLTFYEYNVFDAESPSEAEKILSKEEIDIIVLDVVFPDESGFEFCRKLKTQINIPVIFISSLSAEKNRVDGLLSGGDDYLVKPYSLEELKLRILARTKEKSTKNEYDLSGIKIKNGNIIVENEHTPLTSKELEILLLLWRNRGTYFTQDEIYRLLWGMPDNNDVRTVKFHMSNLRKKLNRLFPNNEYIHTKWGQGYVFK